MYAIQLLCTDIKYLNTKNGLRSPDSPFLGLNFKGNTNMLIAHSCVKYNKLFHLNLHQGLHMWRKNRRKTLPRCLPRTKDLSDVLQYLSLSWVSAASEASTWGGQCPPPPSPGHPTGWPVPRPSWQRVLDVYFSYIGRGIADPSLWAQALIITRCPQWSWNPAQSITLCNWFFK